MKKLSILFLVLFFSSSMLAMHPEQQKPVQGKVYNFNKQATAYNKPGVTELSFIKVSFGQDISQDLMDRFTKFMSDELIAHNVKVRNLIGLNRLVFQGNFGITRDEFQEALDKANKEVFNTSILEDALHLVGAEEVADKNDAESCRVEKQECLVCMDEKEAAEFTILSCEHTYCKECLGHLIDLAIQEKTSAQLKCPNLECAQPILQEDIKKITNHDQIKVEAMAEITTREFLATHPGAKQCRTPNCSYVFINDDHMQTITCPQCDQKYCSQCLFDHANTMTCQEADDLRPSDRDTAEWLQQNTKPCPNCHARVERNEGCLYITCRICKKGFCWNCNGAHHVFVCNEPPAQQIPISQIAQQTQQVNHHPHPDGIAREREIEQQRIIEQQIIRERANREQIRRRQEQRQRQVAERQAAARELAAQRERERVEQQAAELRRRQETARLKKEEEEREKVERQIRMEIEREENHKQKFPGQPYARIVSFDTIVVNPAKRITNLVAEVRFDIEPSEGYLSQFTRYLHELQRKNTFVFSRNKNKQIQLRGRMGEAQMKALVNMANGNLTRLQKVNWLY